MNDIQFSFTAKTFGTHTLSGTTIVDVNHTEKYEGNYLVQVRNNGVLYVFHNDDIVLIATNYRLMSTTIKDEDEQD